MKRLIICLLPAFFITSCNSNKDNSVDYSLEGTAINATVTKNAKILLSVTGGENGKYKCTGKFDDKNLFGRFEMDGVEYDEPSFPEALSIRFKGDVNFGGNDESGYPAGTKTTMSSTIHLFSDNAIGNYLIYEIQSSEGKWKDTKQNGIFYLAVHTEGKSGTDADSTKVPANSDGFEGEWKSNERWNITIIKVSDEVYDLKCWNAQTNEVNRKISGPYRFRSDDQAIHRDVPIDYNDRESIMNDIGKEYRINSTKDGRLYFAGTFYDRVE